MYACIVDRSSVYANLYIEINKLTYTSIRTMNTTTYYVHITYIVGRTSHFEVIFCNGIIREIDLNAKQSKDGKFVRLLYSRSYSKKKQKSIYIYICIVRLYLM